ncbi:hypothetical protein KIN20_003434 [Parelaphostrongylus tenuis]|uniref:Uncharacterized protein n=1 Tax=Parelaphostrongylus tenuis TaxID=148309 RepID=A0AAD5MFL6_PARTN|nr:hypothetical protein KIN20_003434 [Parelaphostrongylus tenuis]
MMMLLFLRYWPLQAVTVRRIKQDEATHEQMSTRTFIVPGITLPVAIIYFTTFIVCVSDIASDMRGAQKVVSRLVMQTYEPWASSHLEPNPHHVRQSREEETNGKCAGVRTVCEDGPSKYPKRLSCMEENVGTLHNHNEFDNRSIVLICTKDITIKTFSFALPSFIQD